MQTIHHKKNELFEVEFYQDKECTIPFDFTNARDLYIELKDGDVTPLFFLPSDIRVFTPYIPQSTYDKISYLYENRNICIQTLDDITPNLSKYIPEDNAVLFLSEEDKSKFSINEFSQNVFNRTPLVSKYWIDMGNFPRNLINGYFDDNNSTYTINGKNKGVHPIYRKPTIFLPHGTQSELKNANKVAKELKEKYGVEEVNLFALHWFDVDINATFNNVMSRKSMQKIIKESEENNAKILFNKIITTNSTGILPVQDYKRLQVIDRKEIFEDFLKKFNNY